MPAGHEHGTRMAIVGAIVAFILLNAAFYFLSGNYFDAHREVVNGLSVPAYSAERAAHIRTVFALVSGAIIAVNFAISLHRRIGAHVLPTVLGAASFIGGVASFTHGLPGVLVVCELVVGVLLPTLAWFSYHRSRAAWSFLTAMCGVFALVSLFGAPRIVTVFSTSLWTTMIIPGLFAVAAVALIHLRNDYVERDLVPAAAHS